MTPVSLQVFGRVLLLRWNSAFDGTAPTPEQISKYTKSGKTRYLVLDTTDAPYTDTDGLRWLMRLREQNVPYRIAARPNSKVWRALKLVQLDQNLFDSVKNAWRTPWQDKRRPSSKAV